MLCDNTLWQRFAGITEAQRKQKDRGIRVISGKQGVSPWEVMSKHSLEESAGGSGQRVQKGYSIERASTCKSMLAQRTQWDQAVQNGWRVGCKRRRNQTVRLEQWKASAPCWEVTVSVNQGICECIGVMPFNFLKRSCLSKGSYFSTKTKTTICAGFSRTPLISNILPSDHV